LRRRTARSGLDIISINVWESVNARTEARNFADIWGMGGTVLLDEKGEYAARLGIRGVPTNVLVDSRGMVRSVGVTTPRELNEAVDALLADG
jgi:hypothetical protein